MRAGVIGVGRMGMRHAEAYQETPNVDVVAGCDLRREALLSFSEKCKRARLYEDWQEMLEKEDLDIVSIVTYASTHAEIAAAAARAGVPSIICEKPMATSLRDALEMTKTCHERGVRLAVNYSRRWSEAYRRLRRTITEGVIGRLSHICCTCGGGQLACNGSHFLDLMRMLSGAEPSLIVGFLDSRGTPNPRGPEFEDPGAFGLIHFNNGMRGFIDMYEDLGVPPKIDIVGSIGRVSIDETQGRWAILGRKPSDRDQPITKYDLPIEPYPFEGKALNLMELLKRNIDEILGDGPISCTGEDGLACLEMVMAFHVSHKMNNPLVRLPLEKRYHDLKVNFT